MNRSDLDTLKMVREAIDGLSFGVDWNNGTHAKIYRPKLLAALPALDQLIARLEGDGAKQPIEPQKTSLRERILSDPDIDIDTCNPRLALYMKCKDPVLQEELLRLYFLNTPTHQPVSPEVDALVGKIEEEKLSLEARKVRGWSNEDASWNTALDRSIKIIRQHFAERNGDAEGVSSGVTGSERRMRGRSPSPAAGKSERHKPEPSDSGALCPESQGDGRIATPAAHKKGETL